MRDWTYSYKTSDGLRHEGKMSASSKDAVYEELRKQGIRAIRVDEVMSATRRGFGGLDRREWLIVAGLVAVLVFAAIGLSATLWRGGTAEGNGRDATSALVLDLQDVGNRSEAYKKIAEDVDEAREAYREGTAKIDYELLANYALVERVRDMREFQSVIAYGREVVSNARDAVMRSFRGNYERIPAAAVHDRDDAQRLYGLVMEELDADEERLDSDDCALELLDTNRGRWHVVKGVVKWKDPVLERQFRLFGREPVPGKTRWERDFGRGPRAIESKPVQLKAK